MINVISCFKMEQPSDKKYSINIFSRNKHNALLNKNTMKRDAPPIRPVIYFLRFFIEN